MKKLSTSCQQGKNVIIFAVINQQRGFFNRNFLSGAKGCAFSILSNVFLSLSIFFFRFVTSKGSQNSPDPRLWEKTDLWFRTIELQALLFQTGIKLLLSNVQKKERPCSKEMFLQKIQNLFNQWTMRPVTLNPSSFDSACWQQTP